MESNIEKEPQSDNPTSQNSSNSTLAVSPVDEKTDDTSCEADPKNESQNVLFSTENYKIRVGNLHPYTVHSQLKKKLQALDLKPKKVKKMDRCDWAFVTFGNEEDRVAALNVLEGVEWRGRTLTVKKADAAADPMSHRKRQADETHKEGIREEKLQKLSPEDYKKNLLDKVTPLWQMSYEQQLQSKEAKIKKILFNLSREMQSAYKGANLAKSQYPDTKYVSKLLPIKKSPQVEGYRNKCEFTVGKHPITEESTVGFRLGEYKKGTVAVLEPTDCPNISATMKNIATKFQDYVRSSKYAPFDPVSQQGHWMWLLVRTTSQGDVMVMATFVEQQLSQEELEEVRNDYRQYFTEGDGREAGVTSLYINIVPVQRKSNEEHSNALHLWGSQNATEELLGLKFQISPSAFFQVNAPGAEVLYSSIQEFADLSDHKSTLLDVCCGTGTIGMLLSKHCKEVIGVEIVAEAVKDAEENAKSNEITNISFKCGPAEAVIPELIKTIDETDTVAIVDPPRAGLNRDVIQSLRRNRFMKKLVYVSCEPQSAVKNFVELMRPVSKRWKGEPYRLTKILPVDMFPYTDKCELVLLFERDCVMEDDSD